MMQEYGRFVTTLFFSTTFCILSSPFPVAEFDNFVGNFV